MMLIVVTSLPAADCSTFLLLRREQLDRQWFEAGSAVRPMPRSTMNVGDVGQEVRRPAVGRQPSTPLCHRCRFYWYPFFPLGFNGESRVKSTKGTIWTQNAPACLLTVLIAYDKPRLCMNIYYYAPRLTPTGRVQCSGARSPALAVY